MMKIKKNGVARMHIIASLHIQKQKVSYTHKARTAIHYEEIDGS